MCTKFGTSIMYQIWYRNDIPKLGFISNIYRLGYHWSWYQIWYNYPCTKFGTWNVYQNSCPTIFSIWFVESAFQLQPWPISHISHCIYQLSALLLQLWRHFDLFAALSHITSCSIRCVNHISYPSSQIFYYTVNNCQEAEL